MNIKLTLKSGLLIVLGMAMYLGGYAQNVTGSIRGQVRKSGVIAPEVVVHLFRYNTPGIADSISSTKTDNKGYFDFNLLDLGEYEIRIDSTKEAGGYSSYEEAVTVTRETIYPKIELVKKEKTGAVNRLEGVEIGGKKANIKLVQTTTSQTTKAEDVKKTGIRGFQGMAGLAGGVTNTQNGVSGRGSRADGTAIYVDGVRVSSSSLTQSIGSQVEILQAGIPAQYGDFTGLGISITTKGGVSRQKSASLEVRSSSMFNPYHSNLIEGFYATPILWKVNPEYKTGKSQVKKLPVAAMTATANFQYIREPSPSYIGYYVIKDDKLTQLENNPLTINKEGTGFVNSANFLTANDYEKVKVRPNVHYMSSSAQARFDFRISEYATLTALGSFSYANSLNGGNQILAYKGNPLATSTYVFGYLKYTQQFKGPDSLKKANSTTLNNTYFNLRFDYQSTWAKTQDNEHRDNIFDYGYIGQFKHYPTEFFNYYGSVGGSKRFIDQNGDTVYVKNFYEQGGFRDTAITFTQADINRVRGNYTSSFFDKYAELGGKVTSDFQILQGLGLLNGYSPNNIYSLWAVPGTALSGYSKSQSERYTLYAMGETEVKGPQGDARRTTGSHKLQFGLTYEQSVIRGYSLGAPSLWNLMYQYANSHIANLDKEHPILSYDANGIFQDTVRYNRLVDSDKQTHFDKAFRDKLIREGATDIYGKKIDERTFLDINSYRPSDFTLDMFSADELLNNGSGVVAYTGYDYLGNKVRGRPSVNDFLQDKEKRTIGAFQPIYTAAWFQDQFGFKDLEFRLGLRLERYDANQFVLKDPYSLYPIKQAGEVNEIDGNAVKHPSNIGSDYAVYVDDVKNPRKILGYRKDNTWYDENGTQLASGDLIANRTSNGKIAPYLVNPNQQEVTDKSFKDYKPKVNILPRIFFKFPLNPKSLFFASYDVLAQRPIANNPTIDDYVFLAQKSTANPILNSAMTSRITTDYQIGFKQQVSASTLISLISYYRETKNDIAAFQYNNAYPITYLSYNNLDFSTVKGLILEMDYKAKNNISLTGNYTLQFADGTGSSLASQRALIASNQPNLRSLFPLGDLDIRHQLKAIVNWEFFDGKGITKKEKEKRKYLGPIIGKTKILSNTNFNVVFTATSGLPYTATSQPVQYGAADKSPIKGSPWGSRLPWQFNTNLNVQKDIPLNWKDKNGKSKNAYLQVYYYVTNLLNTKIIYSVYPYTGAPDDDGFLNSPKGQQALTGVLNAEAYRFYYQTAINSPSFYQTPRMMYLGAKVFF